MRSFALATALQLAAAAADSDFRAVSSFAVVTSDHTVQLSLGAGMPPEYVMALPAVGGLVRHYLDESQTLDFINVQRSEPGSLAARLRQHKVVVLPETSLGGGGSSDDEEWGAAATKTLVEYAEGGGAVVVAGGGTLQGAGGGGGAALGAALGLELVGEEPGGSVTATIDNSSNPEWWRLVGAPPPFAADKLYTVRPTTADTLVLATAALASTGASSGGGSGGKQQSAPLLTARRAGERGWLVYTATSAPPVIEMAVNFLLAATGVYLNPGAGGVAGHQPVSFAGPPPPPGVQVTLAYRPAAAAADPASRYRVTLIGAAPNSSTCVQLLVRGPCSF